MKISNKLALKLWVLMSIFTVGDVFAQNTTPVAATAVVASCAQQNPQNFIQGTVDQVLNILQADAAEMTSNFPKIQQDIANYLQPLIGIQVMSQFVVPGPLWSGASVSDQTAFQSAFFNYIVNTYSSAFQQYSPQQQSIQVFPPRTWQCGQTNNVQVNLLIVNKANSAGNIPISFILMPNANSWLLIDFIVSNVDAISNIQSQIQSMNAATLAALTVAISNHNASPINN